MKLNNNKLIIIDGMPGSGKTTCATMLSDQLSAWNVSNRCILELEDNHPLFIQGYKFSSFEDDTQADLFIEGLQALFRAFVQDTLASTQDITIIESVLFQDAINCAYHMGMNHDKLLNFSLALQEILSPLEPLLIYFYQVNVEGQWRFICSVRGNEWGPVALHTDDDFKEAAELWGGSQDFVRAIVDSWDIPKLIIENQDYLWDEYADRINQFIRDNLS